MTVLTDVLDMTAPATQQLFLPPRRTALERLISARARAEHRTRGRHRKRWKYESFLVDVTPSGAHVRLPWHMVDLWVLMPEDVRDRFRAAADRELFEGRGT